MATHQLPSPPAKSATMHAALRSQLAADNALASYQHEAAKQRTQQHVHYQTSPPSYTSSQTDHQDATHDSYALICSSSSINRRKSVAERVQEVKARLSGRSRQMLLSLHEYHASQQAGTDTPSAPSHDDASAHSPVRAATSNGVHLIRSTSLEQGTAGRQNNKLASPQTPAKPNDAQMLIQLQQRLSDKEGQLDGWNEVYGELVAECDNWQEQVEVLKLQADEKQQQHEMQMQQVQRQLQELQRERVKMEAQYEIQLQQLQHQLQESDQYIQVLKAKLRANGINIPMKDSMDSVSSQMSSLHVHEEKYDAVTDRKPSVPKQSCTTPAANRNTLQPPNSIRAKVIDLTDSPQPPIDDESESDVDVDVDQNTAPDDDESSYENSDEYEQTREKSPAPQRQRVHHTPTSSTEHIRSPVKSQRYIKRLLEQYSGYKQSRDSVSAADLRELESDLQPDQLLPFIWLRMFQLSSKQNKHDNDQNKRQPMLASPIKDDLKSQRLSKPWINSGLGLEQYVTFLFKVKGYYAERCGGSGDNGVDVKLYQTGSAEKSPNAGQPLAAIVQCKQYTDTHVKYSELDDFVHVMSRHACHRGLFVTTSDFPSGAEEQYNQLNVEVWNEQRLLTEFREHAQAIHRYELQYIDDCKMRHKPYTGNPILVNDQDSGKQLRTQATADGFLSPAMINKTTSRKLVTTVDRSAQKTVRRQLQVQPEVVPLSASQIDSKLSLKLTRHERVLLSDAVREVRDYYQQSRTAAISQPYLATTNHTIRHRNQSSDSTKPLSRSWNAFEEVILLQAMASVCNHDIGAASKDRKWENFVSRSADIRMLVKTGGALKDQWHVLLKRFCTAIRDGKADKLRDEYVDVLEKQLHRLPSELCFCALAKHMLSMYLEDNMQQEVSQTIVTLLRKAGLIETATLSTSSKSSATLPTPAKQTSVRRQQYANWGFGTEPEDIDEGS